MSIEGSELNNKIVLVTGGTGSFGSSFVEYILKNTKVAKVIVFSRDELKQSVMAKRINDPRIRFFIGDVKDLQRLERAFYKVDVVVHAAALKQVPTLEYNPFEAVKTNILGTQNVIDAAIDQNVKKVLLISSDKAAHPATLYGSTKLCAEKLIINGNAYSAGATKLSAVRYGNVLGTRGSIVEILLLNPDQKKVSLTHPEMTRFWMTVEQTIKLVLFSLKTMEGGEIFIPKVPSMKVVDMFDALVPNAKKDVSGLRPGEKLHEILITKEEGFRAVELKDYYVILHANHEIFDTSRFKKYLKIGKAAPSGFVYASDTNTKWLTKAELAKLIKEKVVLHSKAH